MQKKKGGDVLLVDADEQESASYFTELRSANQEVGYTCIKLSNRGVFDSVLKLKNKYNTVIIDAGGRDTTSQRAALSVSDLALFPFPPRCIDIWSIGKLCNMVDDVVSINPKLSALTFINKGDSRGSDNEDVVNILKQQPSLKYIPYVLMTRKVYANAAAEGKGIIEVKRRDYNAIKELKELYKNII